MSNYDKTDEHRYPSAQTKSDRRRWWHVLWPKLLGTAVGLGISALIVLLVIAVHNDDLKTERQNQINRQNAHDNGIANCKAQHGTIQLDRLGWYIGCLVPTPKG